MGGPGETSGFLGRTRSPTILVAENGDAERGTLRQAAASCGCELIAVSLEGEAVLPSVIGRRLIGILHLELASSGEILPLRCVRLWTEAGIAVIAFAPGLDGWPLRARCLPFLAGATTLLDSAKAGFAEALTRALKETAETIQKRDEEERNLEIQMSQAGIVGKSRAIQDVFRTILRISILSDLPVLITGETGTGKERLASAIHTFDPKRNRGPFIPLNCAALTPTLAESELFGYRRGAFTGAERNRPGLIRAAQGGTLFLDEISEMDFSLQAKLLRVLQERRVLAVGDETESAVDARVLAASNRDLRSLVRENKFRSDLFHRLSVVSIHIPPLRERRADIPVLTRFFMERHQHLRDGPPLPISPDFLDALMQAELPGNVRQLENIVRQALIRKMTATPFGLGDLPEEIWEQLSHVQEPISLSGARSLPSEAPVDPWAEILRINGGDLSRSMDSCERSLLNAMLKQTEGNQSLTARLLGITARSVYNKVHKHRLTGM